MNQHQDYGPQVKVARGLKVVKSMQGLTTCVCGATETWLCNKWGLTRKQSQWKISSIGRIRIRRGANWEGKTVMEGQKVQRPAIRIEFIIRYLPTSVHESLPESSPVAGCSVLGCSTCCFTWKMGLEGWDWPASCIYQSMHWLMQVTDWTWPNSWHT